MSDANRFAAAEKGLAVGRLVAGRKDRIKHLPFPGSGLDPQPGPARTPETDVPAMVETDPPGHRAAGGRA